MIQILLQILTEEVLELKNRGCLKLADIFNEYGITDFSPCEQLNEEFLEQIQERDPIYAINTLLATLNFPPHLISFLTRDVGNVEDPELITQYQKEEQEIYEWLLNSQQIAPHPATARYVRYTQENTAIPPMTAVEANIIRQHYIDQGIQDISAIVLDYLKSEITDKIKCPEEATLNKLINIVNNITSTTNIFQSNFSRLQSAVNVSSATVSSINLILEKARIVLAANDAAIVAATASGVGVVGVGPIVQASRLIDKQVSRYETRLQELDDILCNAAKVITFISLQLGVLRALLEVINALLKSCIEKTGSSATLRQLNQFTVDLPDSITYNGYIIEVRSTPSSTPQLPQRYAVAIDEFGVVVLEGPRSYSSSTSVLVAEIKFRIDNQLG
jgi:hypothetical protein